MNRNQVSNKDDIDSVLKGLLNIMEITLDKVYNDKDVLHNAYMYQECINQEAYNKYLFEQMSIELSREWSKRITKVF